MNKKRILAICGLLLIAGLYIATIIFALIDSPAANNFLMASLFCTIVFPAVIYGYILLLKASKRSDSKKDSET